MLRRFLAVCLLTITLFSPLLSHSPSLMEEEIRHVVVVMMENRSFDNILAWLYDNDHPPSHIIPAASKHPYFGLTDETLSLYTNCLKNEKEEIVFCSHPVKGTPSVYTSSLRNSPNINPHEPYPYVIKQMYGYEGSSIPDMSGFLQNYASLWPERFWKDNKQDICAVMETHTQEDLPIMYALAKHYAVSDLWFSSVPTQTNANRAFAACGTSEGITVNGHLGTNVFYSDTIWNRLYEESPDTTWKIFWQADMLPGIVPGSYYQDVFAALRKIPNIDSYLSFIDQFHRLAREGNLPSFSFLEPLWTISLGIDEELINKNFQVGIQGNDLHPPGDVRTAENFLANIYTSLIANEEAWNHTLLVILFDEHGGLYDHVPPPAAVSPDDFCQNGFHFDRFGVRVPAVFISPRIAKSTVVRSSDPIIPFDHTSLISTLLKWKNVEKKMWKMGKRVDVAPSFEKVVTLEEPRTDNVLADPLEMRTTSRDPISMGDRFYLKNRKGHYLVQVDGWFKKWAQVGSMEERAALTFGDGQGIVTDGSFVIIRNMTPELGEHNVLETILTHCDCVYSSYKSHTRQWWTIKNASHPYVGSPICDGDRIYIENHIYLDPLQFIPARLKENSFGLHRCLITESVSHEESDKNYWIIEKA